MSLARIQEPERMTDEEEDFYAVADYSGPHERYAREIASRIEAGAGVRLADFGCGPGDLLIRLRSLGDWSLWGIDMSPRMLAYAAADRARRCPDGLGVNWVLSDIKRTSLPSAFFEAIMSNSVLHHIEDVDKFWREVKRLAKPGARIFIRDLRRPAASDDIEAIIRANIPDESSVVKEHYRSSLMSAYSVAEVEAQLASAGIEGLQVTELEDRYLDIGGVIS